VAAIKQDVARHISSGKVARLAFDFSFESRYVLRVMYSLFKTYIYVNPSEDVTRTIEDT
jgi:hypothetical protein